MPSKIDKKDCLAIIALAVSVFAVFPEMALLIKGFYSGDHRAQHYPWAFFYAENLKQGLLPWWCPRFHLGFPLLAEGQVGALYFLNFFFYSFLPFDTAYSYGILFHYVLSGIIFYTFLRSLRLAPFSAFFGTLIYLYGTSQGGYYYNIISMKVLAWFPLTLMLIDRIIEQRRPVHFLWLALVFSFQWFAGYLQYAVYAVGFSCLYFVLLLWMRRKKDGKHGWWNLTLLAASVITSFLIALPQLGATFELASFSNRFSYPEEFAFVGSVNPLAAATLFFPHWDGFIGAELYAGAAGLAFIIASLLSRKEDKERIFWGFFVLTILIALGKYNPIYYGLIKLTHFSSFRVPAKFLYFSGMAFAVLSAFGFEKWYKFRLEAAGRKLVRSVCAVMTVLAAGGLLVSHWVLNAFKEPIMQRLRDYIAGPFMDSPVHTKSYEVYMDKLSGFYQTVLDVTQPLDSWNLFFIVIAVVTLLLILILFKGDTRPSAKQALLISAVLFLNLYGYGYTSVKGNYESITYVHEKSPALEAVADEDSLFRVQRVVSDINKAGNFSFIPHMNILQDADITGGYSPLMTARVFEYLEGIGDIDDSHEFKTGSPETLQQNLQKLERMNVKYFIVPEDEELIFAEKIQSFNGEALYRMEETLPRVYFRSLASEGIAAEVKIDKYSSHKIEGHFKADSPGMLILSELDYPGWKFSLNGKPVSAQVYDSVFRAVAVDSPGNYQFVNEYKPIWASWVPITVCLSFLCFIIPFAYKGSRHD